MERTGSRSNIVLQFRVGFSSSASDHSALIGHCDDVTTAHVRWMDLDLQIEEFCRREIGDGVEIVAIDVEAPALEISIEHLLE